jgi:ketosteroid isomerase-like protein
MKRTSAFVALGFLAGLGTGFFAHRAGVGRLLRRDQHAADLAAIEKLHQIDIEFTRSQDYKRLMDIWSEDAVRFMPGSSPDVGKQAILADNEKFAAEYPGFKVLRYAAKYKNIQIEDGLACEWGEHESQFKMSPEAPPVSWRGTGFHVLKRQSDGSWKFALMILNQ